MHICVDMCMYVWVCVGLGVQALRIFGFCNPARENWCFLGLGCGGVGGVWFKGFVALGLTWPSLIKFKEDFKEKVRGF